jgi:hypothetical protein
MSECRSRLSWMNCARSLGANERSFQTELIERRVACCSRRTQPVWRDRASVWSRRSASSAAHQSFLRRAGSPAARRGHLRRLGNAQISAHAEHRMYTYQMLSMRRPIICDPHRRHVWRGSGSFAS